MERTKWSDERLDDRFDNLDRTLARIDRDIRDLRGLVWRLWATNIVATVIALLATRV
jgi:hypothetical protein